MHAAQLPSGAEMTSTFFNLKAAVSLRGIASLVFLMSWGICFLTMSSEGAAEDPWLSPPQPNTNLPVLTQVRQVHELTADEARKQYPVKIQAVVTYFDPHWRTLFIQDETGGSWVYRTYQETNLYAGDLVEVNGASWSVSIYGVAIKPTSIRVVGKAPLPTPKPVTYETMASGKDDGVRSQVQGVVRSMAYQYGLLELGLVAGNDQFNVYVPRFEDHPLPENLLGARVEVSGVCSMKLDARALITGLWYYAPDPESVSILRAPALDPYSEPTQPINSLLRYDSWAAFGERVKIAGVVTHWVPSGRLFLRDETRSVPVDLMQPWAHADSKGRYLDPPAFPALKPGDRIEVVGYRSIKESQFSIVDAEFRLAGPGSPPDARNVLPEAALSQDLDGELISLQARLIEIESRPVGKTTNQVLSLMAGDALFEAELVDPGRAVFKAEKNSLVRVTGVNTVQTDPSRRARFFRLLMRNSADATVLQAPPGWTLRLAGRVGSIGGLVILAGLVWIVLLRRQVALNTAELRRANVRLQELNALKSNFISMVSHEIRTPLALIQSSGEILGRYLERLSTEKRKRHLDTIGNSVSRMVMLVEDVLMFSRAEAGPMEFKPAPLDLPRFCHQLVDEVISATARRCPIRLNISKGTGSAGVDEMLMRHVLVNLLTNAVKFSKPGDEVLFETSVTASDVVFQVQDRGIGIPEADRAKIFEPFYRSRNVAHIPGTGLGLVIVKRCVERHGGTLEIESREGQGSRFTVRVPTYSPGNTEVLQKHRAQIEQVQNL
jgi:signal transduction histidine kinase